ncbi:MULTISPECIES: hypothetical protein [unclassified Methylocaldum]|jgi:hypothetical protein|uniref:hypothetical protein n=1 Tax=unclassified Methylocaldum TaxID=2622260 RepID=UPI00098A4958|nr:hypothetical protein [Methylocaldum sp. 14B]
MLTSTFIADDQTFAAYKAEVEKCCRIEARLPEQVFREGFSRFAFEEFDWAMSATFWPAIQALCRSCGDVSLLVAVLDPDPTDYYKNEFGFFNWAVLPVSASADEYWNLLNQYPDESPADSLLANSEKVVWLAQSGKWAVWGERSLEVCILGCRESVQHGLGHDVEWALKTAMPNCFRERVVPPEYAERLRQNYGALA